MKEGNLAKKINLWLPVVVWAGVIFSFSCLPTTKTSQIFIADFILKKTAHVTEYAILAILLYRALRAKMDKKRSGYWALGLAVLYAMTDEFHQGFTPGREPTIRDVIIDTIGASLAIYLIWNLLPKAPKKLKIWAKRLQLE